MDFLPMQNNFVKSHNNKFMLPDHTFINSTDQTQITENNNQISANGNEKTIQEVWSKDKFNTNKVGSDTTVNFSNVKMSWAEENPQPSDQLEETTPEVKEVKKSDAEEQEDASSPKVESPSHHARRPPNAFLIFCKKHRSVVRDKFPSLENRGVTKILGEWWALLDNEEKQPYSKLATEYKDAFLSANPDFRWYKLPAPPLRTLSTRPVPSTKIPSHLSGLSSPSTTPSEFTPGKLADESQLGSLTTLMMTADFTATTKNDFCSNEEKKISKTEPGVDKTLRSPLSNIESSLPPKPIKKRFCEYYQEHKGCARSLDLVEGEKQIDDGNLTKQDLMNKVVEDSFLKQEEANDKNGLREVRKSERMCKGKIYERFMSECKLLGYKKESKLFHQKISRVDNKMEVELSSNNNNNNNKPETPKLDLGNTIKRLAERTNVKIDFDNQTVDNTDKSNQNSTRVRSISETSEGGSNRSSLPSFNLELRILNLPSLSYEEYVQRKRESKKRKVRTKTDSDIKHKVQKPDKSDVQLVGSKKRKNKQSITHIDSSNDTSVSNDLIALATLAEVAANTQKINEKISE